MCIKITERTLGCGCEHLLMIPCQGVLDAGEGVPKAHELRAIKAFNKQKEDEKLVLETPGICSTCQQLRDAEQWMALMEENPAAYVEASTKALNTPDMKEKLRRLEEDT
ncbi:MAG: hypothetical protein M1816_002340 [Peltula sp. TS41687]|nr:MAG: hypothetical protein M1816_002340 [Peltula sp. TS41687]